MCHLKTRTWIPRGPASRHNSGAFWIEMVTEIRNATLASMNKLCNDCARIIQVESHGLTNETRRSWRKETLTCGRRKRGET